MRRLVVLVSLLTLLVPAAAAAGVRVTNDRTAITTRLGHRFVFQTRISNEGMTLASGLVAHLNIVDLTGHTYIDPEDWSSNRTRYLRPIGAGGSTTLSWQLNAVTAGAAGIYVAVLPKSGAPVRPMTGPTLRVRIEERRSLNSGGVVPLAVGIPCVLGLLALGVRFRRARAAGW
jgi:hypothetical protein